MENQAELNKRREIADRLKSLRTAKGLTQEKMAVLLEISYTTYSKIENANHNLTLKNLMKIRDVLSIKTDLLLYGETDNDINFDEYIELASMLNAESLAVLQKNIRRILRLQSKQKFTS